MAKCPLCNVTIVREDKVRVSCTGCSLLYHGRCVGLQDEEVETLKSLKMPWLCKTCVKSRKALSVNERPVSPGPASKDLAAAQDPQVGGGSSESNPVLNAISRLSEEIRSLKGDINDMKTSLDRCGELGGENQRKLDAIEKKLEDQNKLLGELKQENLTLKKRVAELEVSLNHAEQDLRSKSVEIRGLPVLGGESPSGLVTAIATKLGLKLAEGDLDTVERLRPKRGDTRPPPIIAKFVRQSVRDELVRLRKVRRDLLTTNDIGWTDGVGHPIYLGEDMSPMNRKLYWLARQKAKEGKIKYVWFAGGRVRCRQADGRPVIIINTSTDLDVFD